MHPTGRVRTRLEAFRTGIGKSAVIYPAAFLQSLAFGTISLGFVFHLRGAHGLEAGPIGGFVAFSNACYLTACLLLPRALARVRPRFAMLTAASAAALLTVGMVAGRSLPVVFVLAGAFGAFQALFWPPVVGWLSTGSEGAELGRAVARFNISWSLGAVLSPFVGGALSEVRGSVAMLAGASVSATVALLLLVASLFLPRVRADRHTESGAEAAAVVEDRSTSIRFPAWAGLAVAFILIGVLNSPFPLYATEVLGFSRGLVGLLLLGRALAAAFTFGALGRWTFWHFRGAPMVLGQLLLAAFALALALARSPAALALTLGCAGVLAALAYVESVFHGVAGSLQRARRMAIHEALLTSGSLCGALGGGFLYQREGMAAVFLTYAALLAAAAGAQAVLLAAMRRRRAPAAPLRARLRSAGRRPGSGRGRW